MHRYSLPFAAFALALTFSAIPACAQAPRAQRVWTTEDVNALRSQGLISIVGPQEEAAPPAAPSATATPAPQPPVYSSRFEDPAWYAEQAAALSNELDASAAALAEARDNIARAQNPAGTSDSVDLNQAGLGVTPEETISILQDQVRAAQNRMDDLADLARVNRIDPGVLRGMAG